MAAESLTSRESTLAIQSLTLRIDLSVIQLIAGAEVIGDA